MILRFKDGSILASGKAVKDGSELRYIGERETPKFSFSLLVKNTKDEYGEFHAEFLDCVLWGKDAENQQPIEKGEMVLVTGREEIRTSTGRDGEPRTSRSCVCDFIMPARREAAPGPRPAPTGIDEVDAAFAEMEDDGDLPF